MPQARPTSRPFPAAQPLRRADKEPSISAPVVAPADPMAYIGHRIDPDRRRGRGATINPGGRYESEQRVTEDDGWGSLEELPPFSTEIAIDIKGRGKKGEEINRRHEIVHPAGQAPLTALGVALAVERMLGLEGGAAPAPGLYLPEVLIEPAYFVRRMKEFGATFAERTPAA